MKKLQFRIGIHEVCPTDATLFVEKIENNESVGQKVALIESLEWYLLGYFMDKFGRNKPIEDKTACEICNIIWEFASFT